MGVTSSEFQQNVTYKRAMEGELANTIEAMDGVQDRLRAAGHPGGDASSSPRRATPPRPCSCETERGPTLTADQVQAIVHLTSAVDRRA